MKKIIFHIGVHKTGSSSIQQSLAAAREALLENGVNFLDVSSNHSDLYLCFCANPHKHFANIEQGIDTPQKAADFANQKLKQYLSSLKNSTWDTAIIAGEELSRLNEQELLELTRQFDQFNATYQIICYVRNPISFSSSYAQESILGGNLYKHCITNPELPHYQKKLSSFINIFGQQNVSVLNFDEQTKEPDGLFSSFCKTTDLEHIRHLLTPNRSNESLPLEGALLMDKINQFYPVFIDNKLNINRAKIPRSWVASIGSTKFIMPSQWQNTILELCENDLKWLQEQFDITFDFKPISAQQDLSIEDINAQTYWQDLAHLLHSNATKMNDLLVQNLTLLSEKASSKGELANLNYYQKMLKVIQSS